MSKMENDNLKEYLEEGVRLGHFEPEVLNVDINDIRKGIMPEFPKDPPEMIGGYSAKSRLVRKDPELPPFIKVTRKDLAKNHLLTDKEISEYMDEINAINDYIKKNPAELVYAMTRYPKDDPRLPIAGAREVPEEFYDLVQTNRPRQGGIPERAAVQNAHSGHGAVPRGGAGQLPLARDRPIQ